MQNENAEGTPPMVPSAVPPGGGLRLDLRVAGRDRGRIARTRPHGASAPRPGGGEQMVEVLAQRPLVEGLEELGGRGGVDGGDAVDDLSPRQRGRWRAALQRLGGAPRGALGQHRASDRRRLSGGGSQLSDEERESLQDVPSARFA